jgi:heme/copper-type cytochrome/quinol oxidase subunit 3
MRLALGITLALALGFLALQGFEYSRKEFGLDTNAYGSLFFTITGTHGAHVALGVLMMSWVAARSFFVSRERSGGSALSNIAIY